MALTKDQRWIFDTGSEVIDLRAFGSFEQVEETPFESIGEVGIEGDEIIGLKRLRTTLEASRVLWDRNTIAKLESALRRGTRVKVLGLHGWGDPLAAGGVADVVAFQALIMQAPKQIGDLIRIDLSVRSSYRAFFSPRVAAARDSYWFYDMGPNTGSDSMSVTANSENLCAVVYVPAVPTGLNSTHDLKLAAKWNDGTARISTVTIADSTAASLRAGIYLAEFASEPVNSQEDVAWLDVGQRALPSSGPLTLGWQGNNIANLQDSARNICVGLCRRARLDS